MKQVNTAFLNELWFELNSELMSSSIHRFSLSISYQNGLENHTFFEEYSFDFSATPQFQSNHMNRLIQMKWIQPGLSLLFLILFLGTLLFFSPYSSYELLDWMPSIYSFSSSSSFSFSFSSSSSFSSYIFRFIQYRLRRVLSIPILHRLFVSFASSLICGVYFVGKMNGIWVIAFAWGVFTFDSTNGLEYAFWTELSIWGALECLGIVVPMVLFCMQSVTVSKYHLEGKRRRICGSRWVLCGVACLFYSIQFILLVLNYPFHLCFLSVNLVLFPLASILIPVMFFRK